MTRTILRNRQRGVSLVWLLTLIAVLTILLETTMSRLHQRSETETLRLAREQARQLAASGVDVVLTRGVSTISETAVLPLGELGLLTITITKFDFQRVGIRSCGQVLTGRPGQVAEETVTAMLELRDNNWRLASWQSGEAAGGTGWQPAVQIPAQPATKPDRARSAPPPPRPAAERAAGHEGSGWLGPALLGLLIVIPLGAILFLARRMFPFLH